MFPVVALSVLTNLITESIISPTRVDANIAPFGCEMMSCTSSGLCCMTSAALLKVTPSRLMLFREIRRPPADKGHRAILLTPKKADER